MIGYILGGLVIVGLLYAVFSNFGVRGWPGTEDGKFWWRGM